MQLYGVWRVAVSNSLKCAIISHNSEKSDLWLIIVVFLQFSMSFTQIDVFFIVLGKSHISFTQIDEILPDLGKTR